MSVSWVACGTYDTKTDGTELSGIELQRSSKFLKLRGGGGSSRLDHLRGHPAMALWLTLSPVELFCNVVSRF